MEMLSIGRLLSVARNSVLTKFHIKFYIFMVNSRCDTYEKYD